MAIFITDDSCT